MKAGGRYAIVAMVALLSLGCAASAPAAVYWSGEGPLGAARFDGAEPNPSYLRIQGPRGPSCDVAVTPTHLYWAEWFGIWRVNLEGPAVPQMVVPGLTSPCGIAVDGNHVYWTNRQENAIGRAALDGSARQDAFLTGVDGPCEVAVDDKFVYWVDWRGVGRAPLAGGAPQSEFISGPGDCGLAVDTAHVYRAGEGRIASYRLDGTLENPSLVTGTGHVSSIAVDGGGIYWVDTPEGMVFSSIDRASFGGTVVRDWIQTERFNLSGLAVDSRFAPPPLPLPSRPFYFGKIRHRPAKGSLLLEVSVPERGDLGLVAPDLGWRVLKGPEPPAWRGGWFRWQLQVWAEGDTPKRIRDRLANKGWARIALRVAYAETGQLALTAVKKVVLRKTARRQADPR